MSAAIGRGAATWRATPATGSVAAPARSASSPSSAANHAHAPLLPRRCSRAASAAGPRRMRARRASTTKEGALQVRRQTTRGRRHSHSASAAARAQALCLPARAGGRRGSRLCACQGRARAPPADAAPVAAPVGGRPLGPLASNRLMRRPPRTTLAASPGALPVAGCDHDRVPGRGRLDLPAIARAAAAAAARAAAAAAVAAHRVDGVQHAVALRQLSRQRGHLPAQQVGLHLARLRQAPAGKAQQRAG